MHSNNSNSTLSSSCWKVFLIYARCMIYLSCFIYSVLISFFWHLTYVKDFWQFINIQCNSFSAKFKPVHFFLLSSIVILAVIWVYLNIICIQILFEYSTCTLYGHPKENAFFSPSYTHHRTPKMHDHYPWTVNCI